MTAVGFQCRYAAYVLCLFPQIRECLCVDDGSWFGFDSEALRRRYVIYERTHLSHLLHSLGYTDQSTTEADIWRFTDPVTQQTYFHSMQMGRPIHEMPGEIHHFLQRATIFFNDQVMSETVLEHLPRVEHFVQEGPNYYRPDPIEDADHYPDFNKLTTFVWNNPSRFRTFTAIYHQSRSFRYTGLHQRPFITREHVMKTVKLTHHPDLQQMYEHYEPERNNSMSDSESDDLNDDAAAAEP